MKVIKGLHDTRHEELGGVVIEAAPVSHDGPQLSAQTHLHQHVHVLTVTIRPVQPEIRRSDQTLGFQSFGAQDY